MKKRLKRIEQKLDRIEALLTKAEVKVPMADFGEIIKEVSDQNKLLTAGFKHSRTKIPVLKKDETDGSNYPYDQTR